MKNAVRFGLILFVFLTGIFSTSPAAVLPVSSPYNGALAPAGGNGDSTAPIISADGRYVLFSSLANNLAVSSNGIPIPTLATPRVNVFLRDRTNASTTLVSINNVGSDGGNADAQPTALSTNGQFVLFESAASNLTTNAASGTSQIFLRDVVNGITTLVSAGTYGSPPNGVSRSSTMTPDGRYVVFVSAASNLTVGDTNGIPDVFRYDTVLQTMLRVSSNAQIDYAVGGGSSELPLISTNGRYMAFYSTATNVVKGLTNSGELYLSDITGGTITWVSAGAHAATYAANNSGSHTSNCISANFTLSDNGQFVGYEACALTAYLNTTYSVITTAGLILRYEVATGLTDLVNTNALSFITGTELNTKNLDMTPDGRFVAFVANVGKPFAQTCIDLWDSASNTTTLVSANTNGVVPASSLCYWPTLSSNGQYVAFLANSSGLTTNVPGPGIGLFLRDTQAGVTTWIDANTNSAYTMTFPRMNAIGSAIAFESISEGLVSNDNNHVYNVFAFNASSGATELISACNASLAIPSADGASTVNSSSMSTNGRFIAFASDADDLVTGDTNGFRDIFVRDILTGSNFLVSANGSTLGNGMSTSPAISGSGRFVAFTSGATNLVANDTNRATDIFVCDLQSNTLALVSVNTNGNGPGNGASFSPLISVDGRYVLFQSAAANLVTNSIASTSGNLFWRDTQAGLTLLVTASFASYSSSVMTPDGHHVMYGVTNGSYATTYLWSSVSGGNIYTNPVVAVGGPVAVSPDGTRMAYYGTASVVAVNTNVPSSISLGLVPLAEPAEPNLVWAPLQFSGDSQSLVYVSRSYQSSNQIYLYNFTTQSNLLISQNYNFTGGGNGNSDFPTISGDGQFIAYRSFANNLVTNDTNGLPDIFLYSVQTGATTLVTPDINGYGSANNRSLAPVFSGAGEALIFESWATDLAGDFNQWGNLYAFQPYVLSATNAYSLSIQNFGFATVGQQNGSISYPTFNWLTTPGFSYLVQYKNTLTDPSWQNLTNNVSVVGGEGYAIDLTPNAAQRFYRLIGVP